MRRPFACKFTLWKNNLWLQLSWDIEAIIYNEYIAYSHLHAFFVFISIKHDASLLDFIDYLLIFSFDLDLGFIAKHILFDLSFFCCLQYDFIEMLILFIKVDWEHLEPIHEFVGINYQFGLLAIQLYPVNHCVFDLANPVSVAVYFCFPIVILLQYFQVSIIREHIPLVGVNLDNFGGFPL